jgi:hypothetical protein
MQSISVSITVSLIMKTTSLVVALTLAVAATSALAADQTKETKPAKTSKKSEVTKQDDSVLLTGSLIKQKVRRSGMVTDSANQVLVLNSETISNSGASDLRQLLTRRGIH